MKRDFDQIKFICHNGVELPTPSTELAGAVDLTAREIVAWYDKQNNLILNEELGEVNKNFRENNFPLRLRKGERILISTDLQLADVPEDFRGDVKSRSGLALKSGVVVLNSPGLIDADYRGDIGVILFNTSDVPFQIKFNDRIAQFEARVKNHEFVIVRTDKVYQPKSSRKGGFGSTDKDMW